MERDAEANWELKIIKTEVWDVKPESASDQLEGGE